MDEDDTNIIFLKNTKKEEEEKEKIEKEKEEEGKKVAYAAKALCRTILRYKECTQCGNGF